MEPTQEAGQPVVGPWAVGLWPWRWQVGDSLSDWSERRLSQRSGRPRRQPYRCSIRRRRRRRATPGAQVFVGAFAGDKPGMRPPSHHPSRCAKPSRRTPT